MSKRKRRRVHRRTDKLSYGIYHGETSVLMSASKRRFSKVRHPKCLAYPKKKAVVLGPLVVIQTLVQGTRTVPTQRRGRVLEEDFLRE